MRKIGIFAGAFDPPTLAHLNLIEKAKKICDHLIVVLAHNPIKKALFSKEEKLEMLQKIAKGCEVIGWQGLLLDLAKEKKASFFIQGIKEDPMGVQRARANLLLGDIETVFLCVDSPYSHLSSSLIKELGAFQADLRLFLPKEVIPLVQKKFLTSEKGLD